MAQFQERARSGNPHRSRPGFVQSVWQHSGQSSAAAKRKIRRCEDLARMAHDEARPPCDLVLPYQRRGIIFPASRRSISLWATAIEAWVISLPENLCGCRILVVLRGFYGNARN